MSAKLMGRIWDLDLPHPDQQILLAMADHGDHLGNHIYPSIDLIAWKTGYSERQVRRIVKGLEVHGILQKRGYGPHGLIMWAIDLSAAKAKPAFKSRKRPEQSGHFVIEEDSMSQNGQDVIAEDIVSVDMVSTPMTNPLARSDIAMSTEPKEPKTKETTTTPLRGETTPNSSETVFSSPPKNTCLESPRIEIARARPSKKRAAYEDSPAFCMLWDMGIVRPSGSKGQKAEAFKRWSCLRPDPEQDIVLRERILTAYAYQTRSRQWQEDGGQYVPELQVWIGKQAWEGVVVPDGWTRQIPTTGPDPTRLPINSAERARLTGEGVI